MVVLKYNGSDLVVGVTYYHNRVNSMQKCCQSLENSMYLYRKTLDEIYHYAIMQGEVSNVLNNYIRRVCRIEGTIKDFGDNYNNLVCSFLEDLDSADDLLYSSGFSGRKYLTDRDFYEAGQITSHYSFSFNDLINSIVYYTLDFWGITKNYTNRLDLQIKQLDEETLKKLNKIKKNVRTVDSIYNSRFYTLNSMLKQIKKAIDLLDEIICPTNNCFSIEKIKKLDPIIYNINTLNSDIQSYKNITEDELKKYTLYGSGLIVSNIRNVVSKAKKNYDSKGTVYKAVQYGKCVLKIGKGIVKIVGAIGAGSTGVAAPIAVVEIISAGNDIANAAVDITNIATKQYDEVGKKNILKDCLIENGGYIGSNLLGNKKLGENIGTWVYTGVDVVSFLDGADKMLKSFGKLNTVITDTETYSTIWGEAVYDDVWNNEIKFKLEPDYFIRKIMKVNPSSTGNIAYESVKNIYKNIKGGYKLGESFAENTQ